MAEFLIAYVLGAFLAAVAFRAVGVPLMRVHHRRKWKSHVKFHEGEAHFLTVWVSLFWPASLAAAVVVTPLYVAYTAAIRIGDRVARQLGNAYREDGDYVDAER